MKEDTEHKKEKKDTSGGSSFLFILLSRVGGECKQSVFTHSVISSTALFVLPGRYKKESKREKNTW